MNKDSIRVLLVDDHARWCQFLSGILCNEPELRVVGEASNGVDAVDNAKKLQPDLILLDIGLPELNGLEAARQIVKDAPRSKILFVSENRSPDIVKAALSTGGLGYVLKSDAGSELLPAVKAVLESRRFVSSSFTHLGLLSSKNLPMATPQAVEGNPYLKLHCDASIPDFLASVIDATSADFGSLQLLDSTNQTLRIVAQHGFGSEFLQYFDTVSAHDACLCGAAMNGRSRIVVADVATDSLLSNEARDVLLRSNVRSVQATPLVDATGKLIGMLSTHYNRPAGATAEVLERIDNFVASFLAKIRQQDNVVL